MQMGSKAIFHLEAFVAKFMSIYKRYNVFLVCACSVVCVGALCVVLTQPPLYQVFDQQHDRVRVMRACCVQNVWNDYEWNVVMFASIIV